VSFESWGVAVIRLWGGAKPHAVAAAARSALDDVDDAYRRSPGGLMLLDTSLEPDRFASTGLFTWSHSTLHRSGAWTARSENLDEIDYWRPFATFLRDLIANECCPDDSNVLVLLQDEEALDDHKGCALFTVSVQLDATDDWSARVYEERTVATFAGPAQQSDPPVAAFDLSDRR